MISSPKYKTVVIWFGVFTISFFAFFTIVYPYSIYSLNKSFTFETPYSKSNGYTHSELLQRFEANYEKDLDQWYDSEIEDRNLVVVHTQYILDIFKQEWLLDDSVTKIDEDALYAARGKLQSARSTMFDFLFQLDLTYDQKQTLRYLLSTADHQIDEIDALLDNPFYTRTTLKRVFGNLEESYTVFFSMYRQFYASCVQTRPTFSIERR